MGERRKKHHVTLAELIDIMKASDVTNEREQFYNELLDAIEDIEAYLSSVDRKTFRDNFKLDIHLNYPLYKDSVRFADLDPNTLGDILKEINPSLNIQIESRSEQLLPSSQMEQRGRLLNQEIPAPSPFLLSNPRNRQANRDASNVQYSRVVQNPGQAPSTQLTVSLNELTQILDSSKNSSAKEFFSEDVKSAIRQIESYVPEMDKKTFRDNFTVDLTLRSPKTIANIDFSDIQPETFKTVLDNIYPPGLEREPLVQKVGVNRQERTLESKASEGELIFKRTTPTPNIQQSSIVQPERSANIKADKKLTTEKLSKNAGTHKVGNLNKDKDKDKNKPKPRWR